MSILEALSKAEAYEEAYNAGVDATCETVQRVVDFHIKEYEGSLMGGADSEILAESLAEALGYSPKGKKAK